MTKHPTPPSDTPQPGDAQAPGRTYWRNLDEYLARPDFQEAVRGEFPALADTPAGIDRRQFMRLMAASFALGGLALAGCRRPEERILPYSRQPERVIPGLPVRYATSMPSPEGHVPLVVETHEARPTKLEGNDLHAPSGGATDLFCQASILDLYDPDRMASCTLGGEAISRGQAELLLGAIHRAHLPKGGEGLAFLLEPSDSPSRDRLVARLGRLFPKATWTAHDAATWPHAEQALGARPVYGLAGARRILALDADFLRTGRDHLRLAREFADGRRVLNAGEADPERMNRLYVAESGFSATGALADHRLRIPSSHAKAFAGLVLAEVLAQSGRGDAAFVAALRDAARAIRPPRRIEPDTRDGKPVAGPGRDAGDRFAIADWARLCASDLLAHAGAAVVIPGDHQPAEVHRLAAILNDLLGANGTLFRLQAAPAGRPRFLSIADLAAASAGVRTLVVLGGNPAYDAPSDIDFPGVLRRIAAQGKPAEGTGVFRLALHHDETAQLANVVLAGTHFLEHWGDGRAADGTVVPVQPAILPLYDGFAELEVLARIAGDGDFDAHKWVRETFAAIAPDATDAAFARWLRDGVLPGSALPTANGPDWTDLAGRIVPAALAAAPLSVDNLEVVVLPSPSLRDGRFANNGWCQELPDAMTKLCWDNAILVSPRLADELGIDYRSWDPLPVPGLVSATPGTRNRHGRELAPVVRIQVGTASVEGPLHIMPGLADYSLHVVQGYGRRHGGRIASGCGFDAFPLTSAAAPAIRTGARLALTGRTQPLACTQHHWSMEGRGDIVREEALAAYAAANTPADATPPTGGDQAPPRGDSLHRATAFADLDANGTVTDAERKATQQWGMVIDLSACISCNACVIACQAENNIPIVGRDQVMAGREMHWIRVDRYFSSGSPALDKARLPEDPQAVSMPVACMHCEAAPCETVCPVHATVHDHGGINVMAYNRCVGTRYCANNCPYKTRRFNFFDYNKRALGDNLYAGPAGTAGRLHDRQGVLQMSRNPDVTVRMRGVMEKCTFCVQRIEEARIRQRTKAGLTGDTRVPDGLVRPACAQACPAGAIVFGDVSDPATRVSKWKASDRDYAVLDHLATRPRTTYLARLRNPFAPLAQLDGTAEPLTRRESSATR